MSDIAIRITDPLIPQAVNATGAVFLIEQGGQTKQITKEVLELSISQSSPTNLIQAQYWITAEPNPDDGLYHRIKVTMGTDGEFQREDLGPI